MGCCRSKPEDVRAVVEFFDVNTALLQTGDIILFSDTEKISGRLISFGTHSEWTHCGVVIHSPSLYPKHGPLLLESEMKYDDGLDDISTLTKRKEGVRLVDLSSRLQTSKHQKIAVLRLQRSTQPSAAEKLAQKESLQLAAQKVIADVSRSPYERKAKELVYSAVDLTPLTHNAPDMSSVFCSELVAYALQELEIINRSESANEFTPRDFLPARLARYLIPEISYAEPLLLKDTKFVPA